MAAYRAGVIRGAYHFALPDRSTGAVGRNSDFGGAVGTGFRNGACVRIWARPALNLTYRPSYPIEAYLDTHYHY